MLFYFHIVKFLRFSLSISNICAVCSFPHICLGVFPSGEVLVCFWIFWCGNILLLTITFFCVADFSTPQWMAIYCWLPATAYSTYWQVPFISWGIFCVCNYRICHGIMTRTHMTGFLKIYKLFAPTILSVILLQLISFLILFHFHFIWFWLIFIIGQLPWIL
jgi:hypothetical protein